MTLHNKPHFIFYVIASILYIVVAFKSSGYNLKSLSSIANNPDGIEYGTGFYLVTNTPNSDFKPVTITPGTGDTWNAPAFAWDSTSGFKLGKAHTHPEGNAPSPSDIMSTAGDLSAVPTADKEFYKQNVFRTVITPYGNYVVKVKDWPGFLAEYNTWSNTRLSTYTAAYLALPDNSVGSRFLQKFGSFLHLYKSNPNSTDYTPLKILSTNGAVTTVDCPD